MLHVLEDGEVPEVDSVRKPPYGNCRFPTENGMEDALFRKQVRNESRRGEARRREAAVPAESSLQSCF